jgi:hypothetical protein
VAGGPGAASRNRSCGEPGGTGGPAAPSVKAMTTPSPRIRAGLALLAITGLLDLAALFALGDADSPKPVVVASGLSGLVTLAGVACVWRGRRGAMYVVLAALAVDLVLDVPAYFLDAPGWVLGVATATLVLLVAGVGLLAPFLRRRQAELVGS